jgi:type I restriction enzyme M protein
MPQFGKRTQLTREHFAEFEVAYGDDPFGTLDRLKKRKDTGETGRFRCFTREQIAERGDSLDISWLKDDNASESQDLPEPAVLAQEAMSELEAALEELQGILGELGEEVDEVGE